MVELHELNLIPVPVDSDNYWPPDIDQHVAQLEFDTSTMDGQSVFGSVMVDPGIISTDSLDMETLRARCENNKQNDYKLIFDDSGQWTTSGIGGSFSTNATASPPTPQTRRVMRLLRRETLFPESDNHNLSLRLLEELNNGTLFHDQRKEAHGEWKDKLLNEVLNNNTKRGAPQFDCGGLTTWGKICSSGEGSGKQPFDPSKIYSLPELNRTNQAQTAPFPLYPFSKDISSPAILAFPKSRQNSLVMPEASSSTRETVKLTLQPRSFAYNAEDSARTREVEEEEDEDLSISPEYNEHYLGNGRYIDMNENEIGYVPPSTAPIQRQMDLRQSDPSQSSSPGREVEQSSHVDYKSTKLPRRTFADFSKNKTELDLRFIALSHCVPSICKPSASLDDLLMQAKEGNLGDIFDCCAQSDKILSTLDIGNIPDSGLGSSSSEGPSHIEDWSSLSILLPRNVVEAYSFFKSNSILLAGSSNNIERRCHPHSTTSTQIFRQRKDSSLHRESHKVCCQNCMKTGSSLSTRSAIYPRPSGNILTRQRTSSLHKLRLHAKELAIIGLPMYDKKRNLVERVVEGVAEIIRGASSVVFLTAMEKLISDGLNGGVHSWDMICRITGQGPMTASLFELIEKLEASEKPANSRVNHFLQGLLDLHSVDGWFSYVILKEHVLRQLYGDNSFLLGAQTCYRSLFSRFMECLELLSVLDHCGNIRKRNLKQRNSLTTKYNRLSFASRLPSDSRVPKSSSVPAKLSNNNYLEKDSERNPFTTDAIRIKGSKTTKNEILDPRPSRIPLLIGRPYSTTRTKMNLVKKQSVPDRFCCVHGSFAAFSYSHGTILDVKEGECVRVISVRGSYSRCSRLGPIQKTLMTKNGIIPTTNLQFLK